MGENMATIIIVILTGIILIITAISFVAYITIEEEE